MNEHLGEKTEQATPRRLEEALKRGQFPRSAEVQTVFVLGGGLLALVFAGHEIWRNLASAMFAALGHLHDASLQPFNPSTLQRFVIDGLVVLGSCVWPILAATVGAGLLAGGLQSRFHASPEALRVNWSRLDPVAGLKRIFSMQSAVPTAAGAFKLMVVIALSYGVIEDVLRDPIFYSSVDLHRIGVFMAEASLKIVMRVLFALIVLAAMDYGYQFYRNQQEMMMTKAEVKEELKNQEGDPKMRAKMRSRRQSLSKRKQLAEVPKADVIVTNPTHLAIALRYDRKTMSAPRIVAKGSRLNALRIREIAEQHQVPIIENKPLARLMFKYGRVGAEIPAQLYAAVAEILAYVYRVNAYRYYREQTSPA